MPDLEITQLLHAASGGEPLPRPAVDRIFAAAYRELRASAGRAMRRERSDHTLQPTELINEVYLRLAGETPERWQDRAHFFGIASRAMRQVLVDHARRRCAQKRGAGRVAISLEDAGIGAGDAGIDLVDLERSLQRLARLHPRMARVVELRVFGGLSGEEISLVAGVSRKTVVDDWRVAVLWLRDELSGRPHRAGERKRSPVQAERGRAEAP